MSNQSTKSDDMNDDGMLNAEMQRKLPQGKILQPKLRFKGFADPWQQRKLEELLIPAKAKNVDGKFTKNDVLSVSGEFGIVNQIALKGKSSAGESVLPYSVVNWGDAVYTKSPLKEAPYGIIKVNQGRAGIVSTLYAVYTLRQHLIVPVFLELYFDSNVRLNNYLKPLVNKGAKNDMKVKNVDVLKGHIHITPNVVEQARIAEFFRVLDDRIAAAKKKADLLKLKKRYYLQAIFSQQLRFKGFTEPWQQRKYSDYLIESNIPGHDGSEANKLTVKLWGKGVVEKETVIAGSNATKYYIRHTGQLMYGKLDFLHAAFGLVPPELDGYESTADSPAFDILPSADPDFILMTCLSEHTYLYQGNLADGSRKAKRVHVPTFLDMSLNVPNIEEQRRIVSFLHIIDKLIAAANHKAEVLIQQKNAYLQRLFV